MVAKHKDEVLYFEELVNASFGLWPPIAYVAKTDQAVFLIIEPGPVKALNQRPVRAMYITVPTRCFA